MTDKKTRIVSNLLSLVLGAGIGAGVYAIKEQITHGFCQASMTSMACRNWRKVRTR